MEFLNNEQPYGKLLENAALYPGQIIQKIKNSTSNFGLGDLSIPLIPSNIQLTKEKKSTLLHLLILRENRLEIHLLKQCFAFTIDSCVVNLKELNDWSNCKGCIIDSLMCLYLLNKYLKRDLSWSEYLMDPSNVSELLDICMI
jgi:hypothetical protein